MIEKYLHSIYNPVATTAAELAAKPNAFGTLFVVTSNDEVLQFVIQNTDGGIVGSTGKTLRYLHPDTKIREIF